MNPKIGDVLAFIGNDKVKNKHYDNFEIGKSYKILNIVDVGYDLDDVFGYNSKAILFENHMYGCLFDNVKDFFIKIDDYRNCKINQIINESNQ